MAIVSQPMSWSPESYQENQFVNITLCSPQPYSLSLAPAATTAPTPFGIQLSSAQFANYTAPRYLPDQGYGLQTSNQNCNAFQGFPWAVVSEPKHRPEQYNNLIYASDEDSAYGGQTHQAVQHSPSIPQAFTPFSQSTGSTQLPSFVQRTNSVTGSQCHDQPAESDSIAISSPRNKRTLTNTEVDQTCCPHENCFDEAGNPRRFSRKADVARHVRSQHRPVFVNCPRKNCARKGLKGFTREDHLTEHLRGFHMERIPKKRVGKKPNPMSSTAAASRLRRRGPAGVRVAKNSRRTTVVKQDTVKTDIQDSPIIKDYNDAGIPELTSFNEAGHLDLTATQFKGSRNRTGLQIVGEYHRPNGTNGNDEGSTTLMWNTQPFRSKSKSFDLPNMPMNQPLQRALSTSHILQMPTSSSGSSSSPAASIESAEPRTPMSYAQEHLYSSSATLQVPDHSSHQFMTSS